LAIFAALGLAACAQANRMPLGGNADLAVPATVDAAVGDLALPPGTDLAGIDAATARDLARPPAGDAGGPCNLVAQTGCNIGQKCTLSVTNTLICVSDGTQPQSSGCSSTMDDCRAGAYCQAESATLHACRQFCATNTDCTQSPVGPARNVSYCLVDTSSPSVKTCTIACDPVANLGCPAGLACRWGQAAPAGVDEFTDCALPGTGDNLSTCTTTEQCKPGFVCNAQDGKCHKVCLISSPDCSAVGGTCSPPTVTTPIFGLCL
jgi:hypothetical protein